MLKHALFYFEIKKLFETLKRFPKISLHVEEQIFLDMANQDHQTRRLAIFSRKITSISKDTYHTKCTNNVTTQMHEHQVS